MTTEWITLAEAAELEGITYNACVQRRCDGMYTSKTEPNPAGGKDLVYIDVASLSDDAIRRYERRKRDAIRAERAKKLKESGEPPWYVDCDFSWFMQNYKKNWQKALGLAAIIEKYLREVKEYPGQATEFCEDFCRSNLDMSSKNFRRYLARYKEGMQWGEARSLETPPQKPLVLSVTPHIASIVGTSDTIELAKITGITPVIVSLIGRLEF